MSKVIDNIKYKDFNLKFYPHPITGDIGYVVNDKAITQSIKNLVLNGRYESFYQPEKSGRVYHSLFENFDPIVLKALEEDIRRVITNYESRAVVETVTINQYPEQYQLKENIKYNDVGKQSSQGLDQNRLDIRIVYRPINSTSPVELKFYIEKVR